MLSMARRIKRNQKNPNLALEDGSVVVSNTSLGSAEGVYAGRDDK